MKIGILTQALHGNYGGILQNYALQEVLRQMGHEPITLNRHIPRKETIVSRLAKWMLRKMRTSYDASLLSVSQKRRINQNQLNFVDERITTTGAICNQEDFDAEVSSPEYDAFIVGSDQCWRPCYSANISNYFLDFATNRDVKRISYAASFGVDAWEYSAQQTQAVRPAAQKLTAVSVRESSGVDLCREYLGIDAKWVVDPTMLLGEEGFRRFVKHSQTDTPFLTQYLLESNSEAEMFVERAKEVSGLSEIRNNNRAGRFRRFVDIEHYVNVTIEEWISNIANSRLLVTDSFHGAVFAIMFNVPFIVKLNGTRGNTRLESLLSDFGVMECICASIQEMEMPNIDWTNVNEHLKQRREESRQFLEEALG